MSFKAQGEKNPKTCKTILLSLGSTVGNDAHIRLCIVIPLQLVMMPI